MKKILVGVFFGVVFSFMLAARESPQTCEILNKLQGHSERIIELETQVEDLLERNDLTVARLEETFQTIWSLLGEIKWLMNNNAPCNFVIGEENEKDSSLFTDVYKSSSAN